SSCAPTWSASAASSLFTRDEAGSPITIEIQISAALAAELQARTKTHSTPAGALTDSPLPSPASSPVPANVASYERLRDVLLDVKIRFGSRRMLLRDVLALSSGVVVE